jgi:hypothetical protein
VDVVTLEDDDTVEGTRLLKPVMRAGQRIGTAPSLSESRRYAAEQIELLPPKYRQLEPRTLEPVKISARLRTLARDLEVFTR